MDLHIEFIDMVEYPGTFQEIEIFDNLRIGIEILDPVFDRLDDILSWFFHGITPLYTREKKKQKRVGRFSFHPFLPTIEEEL